MLCVRTRWRSVSLIATRSLEQPRHGAGHGRQRHVQVALQLQQASASLAVSRPVPSPPLSLEKKKEKPSRLTAAPALASSGRVKGRRVNLHRARRNDKVLHVGLIKNAGTRQAPFGPTPRHGPCPFLIKFRTFDSIKRHDRGTARYKAAAYFSLAAQTRKTQEARTTHALYPPPTGTTARTSHHAQNGRATAAATPQDLKVVV